MQAPHTLTPPLQTSTLAYFAFLQRQDWRRARGRPAEQRRRLARLAEQEAPCPPPAPVWAARVTPSAASAAAPTTATPNPTLPTPTLLILKEAEDVLPRTLARPAPYLPPARRANARRHPCRLRAGASHLRRPRPDPPRPATRPLQSAPPPSSPPPPRRLAPAAPAPSPPSPPARCCPCAAQRRRRAPTCLRCC